MGLFGKGGEVTKFINSQGFQDAAGALGAASATLEGDTGAFERLKRQKQARAGLLNSGFRDYEAWLEEQRRLDEERRARANGQGTRFPDLNLPAGGARFSLGLSRPVRSADSRRTV